jgi:hypothetical protein
MTQPPYVILGLEILGVDSNYECEGCIYLPPRQADRQRILTGEVPCFECEAYFLRIGVRYYRIDDPSLVEHPRDRLATYQRRKAF